MSKINFASIFYSVQDIKILSSQHVISIQNVNEIFYVLVFIPTLWNLVCALHLQLVSMWTGHILNAP